MQLAEVFQLVDGQVVAGQVQQRVDQHGAVAIGEHETVAVGPLRVGRVVLEVLAPQRYGHVGHAHRGAGVAGLGLLNGIHSQRADGIGHHRGGVCHGRRLRGVDGGRKPVILTAQRRWRFPGGYIAIAAHRYYSRRACLACPTRFHARDPCHPVCPRLRALPPCCWLPAAASACAR